MCAMKIDKTLSAKDILDYFKNWDIDHESRVYIKFHCKRYEFLLKEVLNVIDKININSPEGTLKILDIGKGFQTEILRNILSETIINTLGFEDSRFHTRDKDRHLYLNLNDAQTPELWPEKEEHDLIIMAEVLEHLYTSPLYVFRCIKSYLKTGGYLIIQTPNACSFEKRYKMLMGYNPFEQIRLSSTNLGHFREYTIQELSDIGMRSGFKLIEYSISNYFNDPGKGISISTMSSILPKKFRDGITVCFKKLETPDSLSQLNDSTIFSRGWYDIEKDNNGFFRWGTSNCLIQLPELKRDLQLKIFSSFPEIKKKHVNVIFINEKTKKIIQKVELKNNMVQIIILKTGGLDKLDLGIFVDTTWEPALFNSKSNDQRVLGIGISELKLI